MKQPINVFLSYAREDGVRVAEVYRLLKAKGFHPWMDTEDITGGEDWELAIKQALRRANFILVFLSHFSIDKPGVLQQEIQSGLSIREANLEGERFVIPVRLEECKPPESLSPYQWVDYFAPDGPPRLLRALGYQHVRVWMYAGMLVILVVAASLFWRVVVVGNARVDEFVSGRQEKGPDADSGRDLIGITLLELRPSLDKDNPAVREIIHPQSQPDAGVEHLTPVRSRMKLALPMNAKFRIGIESSRAGYLYVIDRAQYGGQLTPPILLFPTARIRGGDNSISRGLYVELPSDYWAFRSTKADYRGEQITILLAPAALPVPVGGDEVSLDPTLFAGWEQQWMVQPRLDAVRVEDSDLTATPAEAAARNNPFHGLGSQDPAPQYLYELLAKPKTPVMFHFSVSVAR